MRVDGLFAGSYWTGLCQKGLSLLFPPLPQVVAFGQQPELDVHFFALAQDKSSVLHIVFDVAKAAFYFYGSFRAHLQAFFGFNQFFGLSLICLIFGSETNCSVFLFTLFAFGCKRAVCTTLGFQTFHFYLFDHPVNNPN